MQRYLDNLDIILDALKITYSRVSGRYFFPCPIHGSDNYNSLNIYTNSGKWRCFTKHCEYECGDNLFDFFSSFLKCSKSEAETTCDKILEGCEIDLENRVIPKEQEKKTFQPIPRKVILPKVNPNIPFYLKRGYSKEILEKYDLFISSERTSKFYGRIVVPVYDDDRENIVGLLGRSLSPQCKKCEFFHEKTIKCPTLPYEFIRYSKWRNASGFARNHWLFNYWFAKDSITENRELILVESPGNAMKLAQAGIEHVLGLFGTEITKRQIEKIEGLNPQKIYLGLDNDDAGRVAADKISKKLHNFECIPFFPKENDYGDMSVKAIQELYNSIV